MRIKKPSPALIVAVLALIVAATGVAGALPGLNNVKTKNLAKGAVTTKKIRNDAVTAPKVADLKFRAPTLQNGWQSAGGAVGAAPPGFAMDAQGIVHLRGAVNQPSSAGGTIFTLPPKFRPTGPTGLATSCVTIGTQSATLLINFNGEVSVVGSQNGGNQNICENVGFTVLDGVTFVPGG